MRTATPDLLPVKKWDENQNASYVSQDNADTTNGWNWKDLGYKVHPRIHDIIFHSLWNGCSKATEILPDEESVFWLVPFHHPKTRKGAAIKMERNDENHRDAEWYLQGHSTTKLLSSYWSKCHFGFICQLVLIIIFLLYLLLSWLAVRMCGFLKWYISNWASENKTDENM